MIGIEPLWVSELEPAPEIALAPTPTLESALAVIPELWVTPQQEPTKAPNATPALEPEWGLVSPLVQAYERDTASSSSKNQNLPVPSLWGQLFSLFVAAFVSFFIYFMYTCIKLILNQIYLLKHFKLHNLMALTAFTTQYTIISI